MTDPAPARSLPLVFDEPKGRGKPPRHLADLDLAERTALLTEKPGCPASARSSSRTTTSPVSSTTRPR